MAGTTGSDAPIGRTERFSARPIGELKSFLERRDLVRLVGEPAGDAAAEDGHHADKKDGDQSDEEAVLGHGDTGVIPGEPAERCCGHGDLGLRVKIGSC